LLAERPDTLGNVPVMELRPALVQAFLDGYGDRLAQQKCAQTALKSLEKWALVRDKLPGAITLGTEAPGGTGGHVPWTDEHVAIAEQHAAPHLAKAVTLAANTGQRGSDIIKMRWSDIEDYEGRPGINVTQYKTGLVIWIPLTQELMGAMRRWERRPGYFLLKEAGAGVLQIADMVGMSAPMVSRYSRKSVQRENALAAVVYLDSRTPREQDRHKVTKNQRIPE
jgi:integrase